MGNSVQYQLSDLYADVVQVWHRDTKAFGSGRLVAPNLLLTAKHVITANDTVPLLEEGWSFRLHSEKQATDWTWHDAILEWTGKDGLDLALLRSTSAEETHVPKLALRIAKLTGVAGHPARALGFPKGAKEAGGPRKLVAPSGTLTDVAELDLTFGIEQSYQPEIPNEDWPGLSGGALAWDDGRDPKVIWVYGTARQVPPRFKRQLDVARLEHAYADSDFLDAFRRVGVALRPAADPVERADIERDQRVLQDAIRRITAGLTGIDDARSVRREMIAALSSLRSCSLPTRVKALVGVSGPESHLPHICCLLQAILGIVDPGDLLSLERMKGVGLQQAFDIVIAHP